MNFNDVAIITVGRNDYRIPFRCMTKCEAVNIMKNPYLKVKSG